MEGVTTEMSITTAEEKAQRRLEVKAISTLMMGIPNEHQLKFNSIKDAKKLLEVLELLDEKILQEDVNQKLLRILSPKWNTHVVVWRNKADLDTIIMDDLYNNLKVYEPEVKGMSSSSSSTQNMALVSSSNNNTGSINGAVNTAQAVNTAHGVSTASTQVNDAYSTSIDNLSDVIICAFFASQPNSPQLVHEDLQQIQPDNMEEIDLRWQMAMLTMRARIFLKIIGRKLISSKKSRQQEQGKLRRSVSVETSTSTSLVSCDGLGGYDWSDQAEEGPNYALMAFSSSRPDSEECQIVDNCKKGLGYENYNAVPPPYTGNFMPPTPDLSFTSLDEFVNKPVVENCKAMSSEEEPKVVRKYDDAPSIKEWVSDDEEEDVSQPKTKKKTVRPSIVKKEFVKSKQQEKTARKTVKQVDCNYHQKQFQNQRMVKPVWNNAQRVNHQNFAKKTHPCAKKNMVPRAVLMKSGLVSINTARQNISKTAVLVNTARQVNTAHSKTIVNAARPMSYLSKTAHSTVKRPIHKNTAFKNSNINQRVNTVRGKKFNTARPKAVVNVVKGNNFNAVKALACWVWKPKHKVLDHVSKHNSASITLKKFDYVDAQGRSKNKKDKRGIVIRNKARLVDQEYTQEEGIDYDEVFAKVKTASTPMETQKPLLKDEDGKEVDIHMYRSMIGSLMYLTSSRPNIMFIVCACARYQVNPKVSHLHAMKRIFRYLKGQPKLGLWYPKDSLFDLVAYTDSDYAGASLDRKSTDAVVIGLVHKVLQLPRQST
ncbi:hypothetical protein Tco_0562420 [Tanacetum coccineum]